jgi:hypothetical protein
MRASDLTKEDGDDFDDEDPNRFICAKDGDYLMTPFQCENCHVQNIHYRDAIPDSADELLVVDIRRANLDAFRSSEPSTVEANRLEFLRAVRIAHSRGIPNAHPLRGPYPLDDTFGMKQASCILVRSLDRGKNSKTIQFETMRKMRSHFSNFYHTTPGGYTGTVMGGYGSMAVASSSPTNGLFWRKFMLGCHKRMGDQWFPDRAITIEELLASLSLLKDDWLRWASFPEKRLEISVLATALILAFTGALRGEEIPRAELKPLKDNWEAAVAHLSCPHVPVSLIGKFKREVGNKAFVLPLATTTASGIEIKWWFEKMIEAYAHFDVHSGPIFRVVKRSRGTKSLRRAKTRDMNPLLFDLLRRVQAKHPHIIRPEVDVAVEYSFARSFRRGATTHARLRDITEEVISANNRWRRSDAARGKTPSWSMFERYSDVAANASLLTKFSKNL